MTQSRGLPGSEDDNDATDLSQFSFNFAESAWRSQSLAPGRNSYSVSAIDLNHLFFPSGLEYQVPPNSLHQYHRQSEPHLQLQDRPARSMNDNSFFHQTQAITGLDYTSAWPLSPFHHTQADDLLREIEDDQRSVSCQSQCGQDGAVDICRNPNCGEVSGPCTDLECTASNVCTDENCQAENITGIDRAAAATLASITGTSQQPDLSVDGTWVAAPTAVQQDLLQAGELWSGGRQTLQRNIDNQLPASHGLQPQQALYPSPIYVLNHMARYHPHPHTHQEQYVQEQIPPCPFETGEVSDCWLKTCHLQDPIYLQMDDQQARGETDLESGYGKQCGAPILSAHDFALHMQRAHPTDYPLFTFDALQVPSAPEPATITEPAVLHHHAQSSASSQLHAPQVSPRFDCTPDASSAPTSPATQTSHTTVASDDPDYRCKWVDGVSGVCGLVFTTGHELHEHCINAHAEALQKIDKKFSCLWAGCDRGERKPGNHGFAQKSKLKRHLQSHTNFKPVACPICGIRLSAKQSLEQHIRTHTGERPLKCKYPGCNQTFKQKSALTMHMRTHTGEKPLKCPTCGMTFSESSNLSKHRKTHDQEPGQHKCRMCGKSFKRRDGLRRHMDTCHLESLHHRNSSVSTSVHSEAENTESLPKPKRACVAKATDFMSDS